MISSGKEKDHTGRAELRVSLVWAEHRGGEATENVECVFKSSSLWLNDRGEGNTNFYDNKEEGLVMISMLK